ncbi:MAG: 3-deoxy-manno-octulosonate cytidylyltransferase [Planctomycetes bacterium]|nr:3-deoxy-manno-octulosonate cytidylyltransferase [Planctomycetota bacterium]MBL7145364.1 3-deoxy-manno-octulosonate cytidylyltransferase [Phycisphaerae bacterium]
MSTGVIVGVIPARYGSSRFEGKVLADIAGKPMIQWVYERAKQSKTLDELFVAVDDPRVQSVVEGFGGKAILTGAHHKSGTDRIAEVVEKMAADIIVNIQGDQPLIDPNMIDEAVQPMIDNPEIQMSTLKREIEKDEFGDPGVVKVVVDENDFALYFSRSLIPYPLYEENIRVYEHVGLYVYRKDFLLEISNMPQGYLEKIESLEQLRVLEKGYKILVVETKMDKAAGISVDTPEDLERVERLIDKMKGLSDGYK